jgi:D-glycero-D-manno-heptose 1,7-bisphosphate phosphatase|tara:strand:- start:11733 stop:12224 length:492 start_codon:yes stop_codon:yes gene_type:complete
MKAAFLDRDGIINIDNGYVFRKEDFVYQTGIISFLKSLIEKDFLLFILTNQSGIGRNFYSEMDLIKLHNWLLKDMLRYSIKIEKIKYCPHLPSEMCNCRKPNIGMITSILNDYPLIDLNQSILVGDKLSDIECGKRAGVKSNFLINTNTNDIIKQFDKIINKL